jgi:hypothetical protein
MLRSAFRAGLAVSGRMRQPQGRDELAKADKIDRGYVSKVLRLTLLAPDIVEAILAGRQPEGLKLADLLEPFPVEWAEQRRTFLGAE